MESLESSAMPSAIHKTRVGIISRQVHDMLCKVKDGFTDKESLKSEFSELYSCSPTLFSFTLVNAQKESFDQEFFDRSVSAMLDSVLRIQQSRETQHNASTRIGEMLAEKYVHSVVK